ncbi:85/88 kDa calcium-independent phospholipase A2 [Homalodisca vitripennis]|nr:85/88 kDa calcium-independent phospholipase A2 [Homalodisca vitripennis]
MLDSRGLWLQRGTSLATSLSSRWPLQGYGQNRLLPQLHSLVNTLSGIQKLCDVIEKYPSWTIAHLAVYLNLTDCLNSEQVLSHLNSCDPFTGESPLQLAIKEQNLPVVQNLVAANASLEHLDNEANSVFHYAASTNKDIIMGGGVSSRGGKTVPHPSGLNLTTRATA